MIGGSTYPAATSTPSSGSRTCVCPAGGRPAWTCTPTILSAFENPGFSRSPSPFGEVQFSDLHELGGWIDRYLHRRIKLFLSEFTIPTQPDQEFNFYVDPDVAAQWVRDALYLSRHWTRIYALGWVHVYDDPPQSYGGLLTAQGTPKPDFYAFQHG